MRSMTGYASTMRSSNRYDVFIELKSVNSRYFEFKVRSAFYLTELELEMKNRVFTALERGKVDVFIKVVEKNAENYQVIVNHELASKYAEAFSTLSSKLNVDSAISISEISSLDGVITLERFKNDPELEKIIMEMLDELVEKVIEMMKIEGQKTREDIENSLSSIEKSVGVIEELYPQSLDKFKEGLKERIEDLSHKGFEDSRILMEVELVASRTAINEEIVRLKSHTRQMRNILSGNKQGNAKKMDFISQEINRETNTIASKSADYNIIENTIIIKSEIEKIREQLRNLV